MKAKLKPRFLAPLTSKIAIPNSTT